MKPRTLLLAAAMLGAAGIAIGAFGAHLLPNMLTELPEAEVLKRKAWLETGVRYHMYHVTALMALAFADERLGRFSAVAWLWIVGVLVFSGCLYVMSIAGALYLGRIVPLGGMAMLVGWLVLGFKAWSAKSP